MTASLVVNRVVLKGVTAELFGVVTFYVKYSPVPLLKAGVIVAG
jgi:hypothetical protein